MRPETAVSGIFISYRRDDSAGFAGRLADDLKDYFPANLVFMDVTGIAPGIDFRKVIEEKVGACDVLLVVIGKSWVVARNAASEPRLQDAKDFVRLEVASALKRDIPVIPVLVDGASMPAAADLPADLEALAWRNAVELRHARWDADLQALIAALKNIVPQGLQTARSSPVTTPAATASVSTTKVASPFRRWWIALVVAGVIGGGAVLALKLKAPPLNLAPPPTSSTLPAGPSSATGNSGSPAPQKSDGKYPATLPAGMQVTLGNATYLILSARLERRTAEQLALIFLVRMTSNSSNGDSLWDGSFRLLVNEQKLAPVNSLNEIVETDSAKEAEVAFNIPASLKAAQLEINYSNKEATRIPIDLTAAVFGLPPAPPRSKLAGPFPLTLAAGAEVNVDSAVYRIVSAQITRHNMEKLALKLIVRMTNKRNYADSFWDGSFRLLVDDVPRAPVSKLNEVVDRNSAKEGEVLFVFDDTVQSLDLLIRHGKEKSRLPLDLKAGDAAQGLNLKKSS